MKKQPTEKEMIDSINAVSGLITGLKVEEVATEDEEPCSHSDRDDRCCLDCGKELAEDDACAAEDARDRAMDR